MAVLTPPETLAQVPDDLARASFPHRLLPDCESALLLFCAGLYGRNDGYWLNEAGLTDVTGIDLDEEKLEHMRTLYPASWNLLQGDCFEKIGGRTWDIVVVDAPTQLTKRAAVCLPHWCEYANKAVVLGLHWEPLVHGHAASQPLPPMWAPTELIKRANHRGGTYWLVLERV